MTGYNMLYRRFRVADFVGAVLIFVLTLVLASGLSLPRMLGVELGMHLFWNPATPPGPVEMALYIVTEFIFALVTGLLAMSACRTLVPGAGRAQSGLLAAMISLAYGFITMLLQGQVPGIFLPTFLDYVSDLPGWLLGYYLAGGLSMRQELGWKLPASVAGAAVLTMALVQLQPYFFPFYVAGPAYVNESFHPVPVPPQPSPGMQGTLPPPEPVPQMVGPGFHPIVVPPTPVLGTPLGGAAAMAATPITPPSLTPPPITPDAQPTPIAPTQ